MSVLGARLWQRAHRPGLVDHAELAERILTRHVRMAPAPLAGMIRRYVGMDETRLDAVPFVYAEPVAASPEHPPQPSTATPVVAATRVTPVAAPDGGPVVQLKAITASPGRIAAASDAPHDLGSGADLFSPGSGPARSAHLTGSAWMATFVDAGPLARVPIGLPGVPMAPSRIASSPDADVRSVSPPPTAAVRPTPPIDASRADAPWVAVAATSQPAMPANPIWPARPLDVASGSSAATTPAVATSPAGPAAPLPAISRAAAPMTPIATTLATTASAPFPAATSRLPLPLAGADDERRAGALPTRTSSVPSTRASATPTRAEQDTLPSRRAEAADRPTAPTHPAGRHAIDLDGLAVEVQRRVVRQLAIEAERRRVR
ncbi:hypothetical protein AB0M46_04080 [Dactylosporangium sp. NPDC051485]|uniref:hypothetical protein n=1 Tax=Dactylosporangium sp. NPDC051485 TaxID=3154846 RepID=UPI0034173BE4